MEKEHEHLQDDCSRTVANKFDEGHRLGTGVRDEPHRCQEHVGSAVRAWQRDWNANAGQVSRLSPGKYVFTGG